ncbi:MULTISPECIES: ECF transporter S component [unclassified Virgibacillus]|uniref:ECF transporter S component n=1 Tax=unclassified Virgibacillus TaxID=2620237 RepID=UPI0024DE8F1B|nr:ECF transporter S component [Virgibacillus sp. LDC-1]
MNIYKLTLLAILAALAIVGRIVFTFLPNIQPATAIIIICGMLLGPFSALLMAFLVTFLSNMILGTGIWTIWQIVSWGIIGILSGLLGKFPKRIPLFVIVLFAVFSGYLYGFIISLTNYQISGQMFWAYYIVGLPFDTNHAIGNAIFIVLFYPMLAYLIKKYANGHFPIYNAHQL